MSVNFETAKEVIQTLPLKTGTQVYLESAAAQGLNKDSENETLNKVKMGARGLVTFLTLPIFTSLGATYNVLSAVAKGIAGTVTLIQKGKEDEEGLRLCEAAVEHLSFAVYDFAMSFLSLIAGIAYGFNPALVSQFQEKATGEKIVRQTSGDSSPVLVPSGDDEDGAEADEQNVGKLREMAHSGFAMLLAKIRA